MKPYLPSMPLRSQHIDGTRWFWSDGPVFFTAHNGTIIKIPEKFLSDGLSIPKAFQNILSASPYFIFAGILHDYLYRLDCPYKMTRRQVDVLFLHYLELYGVGWIKRRMIYAGVRLAGGASWQKINATYYTKDDEPKGKENYSHSWA